MPRRKKVVEEVEVKQEPAPESKDDKINENPAVREAPKPKPKVKVIPKW